MLHLKRMCVCTTILPVFKDNYPNCAPQGAPQGAPQVPQDKHPLTQKECQTYSRPDLDRSLPIEGEKDCATPLRHAEHTRTKSRPILCFEVFLSSELMWYHKKKFFSEVPGI